MTDPAPHDPAAVALELEKLRGAVEVGFARVDGSLALLVQRSDQTDGRLVDLDARWTVGEAGYESRSSNSCFGGRELQGRVLMTIAAGSVAYRERGFAIRLADDPVSAT